MAAPIKIIKTIEVIFKVCNKVSFKILKLRLPLNVAKINAPKAPTPAASVGVAAPLRIEPSTNKISKIGGINPCINCHVLALFLSAMTANFFSP